MAIVTLTSEDHGYAVPIRDADQLWISARTAWLDDGGHPRVRCALYSVGEREKTILRQHRARRAVAGLAARQVDGILAARLT